MLAVIKSIVRFSVPRRVYQYVANIHRLFCVRTEFVAHGPGYCTDVLRSLNGRLPRECPICGFRGLFLGKGIPPRLDARCPKCRSVERHRLLWLTISESEPIGRDARILHFAPEAPLRPLLSALSSRYVTADLCRKDVEKPLNIEHIDLDANSVDVVICNHVLEHVQHKEALLELHRIMAPAGRLFVTIPIVEGWEKTYENSQVQSPEDREVHFGESNHLRRFGADFRQYMRDAGFELREYTARGERAVCYGLIPGEKVFVGCKASET